MGMLFYWKQILVVIVLALAAWTIYNHGYDAARTKVEKQDAKAVEKAYDSRSSVDKCYDNGGLWNQRTGKCEGGM